LKEILKLLFGKHGINDLKNYGAVFLVQLIDHVDLFNFRLVLNGCVYRLGIEVYDLVNGHAELPAPASCRLWLRMGYTGSLYLIAFSLAAIWTKT
jgi:hypothetical protein